MANAGGTTVIIGAGQAGAHAAVAARQAGLAGPLVLVGEEAHPPYERPPLSKAALTDAQPPAPTWFHPEDRYRALDIALLLNTRAERIDLAAGRVHLAGATPLAFDRLMLATGARPRLLDMPGAARIRTLRTLDDAHALRAHFAPGANVVCIGAGVIGLEVAAAARKRGCTVTVLEAAATPLSRSMSPAIATWLAARHAREGVAIRCNVTVAAVTPDAVLLADGERIPADAVLAGIGIIRNTELAEAAGIACEDGVLVNPHGRTSAPGVFAAGDVAAFWSERLARRLRLESWRHAQNHGIAVGRALVGEAAPYDEIPWFWTDQYDLNIQVAGLPAEAVRDIWRGAPDAPAFTVFHLDATGRLIAATGVNTARDVRLAQNLIAAAATPDPTALADPKVKLQTLLPA